MKLMKFVILCIALASHPLTWGGPWDDSVTVGRRPLGTPVPPQPPSDAVFFQSGFAPAKPGFRNAGDVEALCGSAYRNLTGVPITVTIVPGSSKDRIAYLFVKQTPASTWIAMAYSQNSIPTSVQIPDGAVYCPTMNENGVFYVTVLNGGINASRYYAAQYTFWTDENLQPGLIVSDPEYGCLNVVAIRTTYTNGNVPAGRTYMIRVSTGLAPIRSQLQQGTCPVPEQPSNQ